MDDLVDHQTVPEYNTRAVEKLTGIPADTFRAWERRHGLPAPARTPGNHRLYSERDIAIVRLLKQMTDEGIAISRAVGIARRRLHISDESPTYDQPGNTCLGDLRNQLITAFIGFDTRDANRIMEEALALFGPETVSLDVIQPALVDMGTRWENDEICVAIEHFATSYCMHRLSALFNASQPERGQPTVLASCVEGENHEIGLMITALILSRAGFRVVYLGANLPGCELVEAVNRVDPDAVVLSAPTESAVAPLLDTIDLIRRDRPRDDDPVIGYGGWAFEESPQLRDTVEARYLGRDARSARDLLRQALDSRDHRLVMTSE